MVGDADEPTGLRGRVGGYGRRGRPSRTGRTRRCAWLRADSGATEGIPATLGDVGDEVVDAGRPSRLSGVEVLEAAVGVAPVLAGVGRADRARRWLVSVDGVGPQRQVAGGRVVGDSSDLALMRWGRPPGLARAPCSRVRSWRTGGSGSARRRWRSRRCRRRRRPAPGGAGRRCRPGSWCRRSRRCRTSRPCGSPTAADRRRA